MGLFGINTFNIEIGDKIRINDAGEKIGSLFGEKGRAMGKAIDDLTKDKTIRIDVKDDKNKLFNNMFR